MMPDDCPRCGCILTEYRMLSFDVPRMALYLCPPCDRVAHDTIDAAPTASDQLLYVDWLRGDKAGSPAPHRLEIIVAMRASGDGMWKP